MTADSSHAVKWHGFLTVALVSLPEPWLTTRCAGRDVYLWKKLGGRAASAQMAGVPSEK